MIIHPQQPNDEEQASIDAQRARKPGSARETALGLGVLFIVACGALAGYFSVATTDDSIPRDMGSQSIAAVKAHPVEVAAVPASHPVKPVKIRASTMTDMQAAILGPNEPIIDYFDVNHDRTVNGKDWVKMSVKERHACAIFSMGVLYGFMAGTAGQLPTLKTQSVKKEIIGLGNRLWPALSEFYLSPENQSTTTIEMARTYAEYMSKQAE